MSVLEESFIQLCEEHLKFVARQKKVTDAWQQLHWAQQSLTTLLGIQSMIDEHPHLAEVDIYKSKIQNMGE